MRALARARSLWRNLRHRSVLEHELAEEFQAHLEHRADDLMARGMSPANAMRTARLEFGSLERVKEETRQSVGLRLIDELTSDLRYAFRGFGKNRAFVATAVATLALTIGANTAVFSAVDALLLRTLPVSRPGELVYFEWTRQPDVMVAAYTGYSRPNTRTSFAAPTFARFREAQTAFSDVFAFAGSPPLSLATSDGAAPASALYVSGNYYRGLGVTAERGRTLLPSDDQAGADPVAVISDRYWRRRFAADPGIVGRTVTVNRMPVTLVGVSAPGFDGPEIGGAVELTLPLSLNAPLSPSGRERRASQWWLQMMARLQPGITPEQALGAVNGIFAETVRESWEARPPGTANPQRSRIPELRVGPGGQGPSGQRLDFAQLLLVGAIVVGAVLLMGCLNLANLLLVRSAARRPEIAIRLTLGASRWRIVRQLMTEMVLLALLGGLGGLVVAWWMSGFLGWLPVPTPPTVDTRIDLRALLFTGALSMLTALVFGLWPTLRATRTRLGQLDRPAHGARVTRSVSSRMLLVTQLALSLALLVVTGLLVRTLFNFSRVDLGFNADNLLVFRVDLGSQSRVAATARDLLERIATGVEAVPGVKAVTASAMGVVARNTWEEEVKVSGADKGRPGSINLVRWNFLQAMQVPIVAGRDLQPSDVEGSVRVAVINETMARQLFDDAAPIGRSFTSGVDRGVPIQVVGVSRDMKYARLEEPPPPTLFMPYAQVAVVPSGMTIEVRSEGASAGLASAVQAAVRQVDPMIPVTAMKTQRQQIAETIGRPRALATVMAVAGAVGLALACIGLYGVVSYDTVRRFREIGIRMALGARAADVLRLVMQRTAAVVTVGALLGVGLALAVSRLLASELYGITPGDPLAIAVAMALLMGAALAAAFLPARRAVRLKPTQALHYE